MGPLVVLGKIRVVVVEGGLVRGARASLGTGGRARGSGAGLRTRYGVSTMGQGDRKGGGHNLESGIGLRHGCVSRCVADIDCQAWERQTAVGCLGAASRSG